MHLSLSALGLSFRAPPAEHTFIRYAFSLPTFFMLLGLLCTFAVLPITVWILAGPCVCQTLLPKLLLPHKLCSYSYVPVLHLHQCWCCLMHEHSYVYQLLSMSMLPYTEAGCL